MTDHHPLFCVWLSAPLLAQHLICLACVSFATAVQIAYELNLAWGCPCDNPDLVVMTMAQLAAEAAAYSRDALAALQKVPRLSVAITPIAPIGLKSRPCCDNITQCEALASPAAKPQCQLMTDNPIALTSLEFEKLMLQAEPSLWSKVGWFSSHAYPCAGAGCGLGGDPRPNTNGWNAPWEQAKPW
jgi:hypothetical protein